MPELLQQTPSALLILATFLAAGLIKGIIGLGMPIVVLAMLAPTLGLKIALALMIVPGVIMNVWQSLDGPYFRSNLQRLWSMWLVSVVAIWLGTFVLASVKSEAMTAILGVMLTGYSALALTRPRLPPPRTAEPWLSPVVGGIAGFLFGAAGTYMVPGVLYIELLGLNRDAFVQALGMTFLIITAALGVGLATNAMMTPDLLLVSAVALVPSVAGLWIGRRIRGYVPEKTFRKVFFIWLAMTGLYIFGRVFT